MAAITDFFCGRLVYIRRGDEEEDEEDPTILLPLLSPAPHPHPLPSLRQMTLTFVSPSCGGGGNGKGRTKRERRRRSRAPKNGTNTHGRSAKKRPQRERIAERTRNTKTFCFLRIALPRPQEKREGTDQTTSRLGQSTPSRRENNGSGALAAFRAAAVIIHAPCASLRVLIRIKMFLLSD